LNRCTHASRVSVRFKAVEAIEIADHRRRNEQIEPFATLSGLLMRGHYFRQLIRVIVHQKPLVDQITPGFGSDFET